MEPARCGVWERYKGRAAFYTYMKHSLGAGDGIGRIYFAGDSVTHFTKYPFVVAAALPPRALSSRRSTPPPPPRAVLLLFGRY